MATSLSIAGREYPPVEVTIEPDRVAAFARSLGTDPAAGVPPTYAVVYTWEATAPQILGDASAGIELANLIHTDQEFDWTRQPRVGETALPVVSPEKLLVVVVLKKLLLGFDHVPAPSVTAANEPGETVELHSNALPEFELTFRTVEVAPTFSTNWKAVPKPDESSTSEAGLPVSAE